MADITKCINGCDKKERCYRWTAPTSMWQAINDLKPDKDGKCGDYWDNEGYEIQTNYINSSLKED